MSDEYTDPAARRAGDLARSFRTRSAHPPRNVRANDGTTREVSTGYRHGYAHAYDEAASDVENLATAHQLASETSEFDTTTTYRLEHTTFTGPPGDDRVEIPDTAVAVTTYRNGVSYLVPTGGDE